MEKIQDFGSRKDFREGSLGENKATQESVRIQREQLERELIKLRSMRAFEITRQSLALPLGADMNQDQKAAFGILLSKIYDDLKQVGQ